MAKLETLAALDIGTSKVVCAIAELSRSGEVEIVAKGVSPCRGLSRGALVDSDDTVSAIEKAITEAEKNGYSVTNVLVGLSSEYLSARSSHGVTPISGPDNEITQMDVTRAIQATSLVGMPSDTEIIQQIARGFTVDGQSGITKPIGISGTRLEVDAYVCAAQVSYLQNIRKVVAKAGLDIYPKGLVSSSMASSLAVLTEEEKNLGVAMVDMGLGTLDLSVYSAGEIGHSAVLGQGGWILANDVACYFNIPQSEAERVILEAGFACPEFLDGIEDNSDSSRKNGDDAHLKLLGKASKDFEITASSVSGDAEVKISRKELSTVLEARLQDIFLWIAQQIDQARRKLGLTVTSLVMTGGASQIPGLAQMAHRELEIPVRIAAPCYPEKLPAGFASPIYSTVVGLILHGAVVVQAPEEKVDDSDNPVTSMFKRWSEWLNKVF